MRFALVIALCATSVFADDDTAFPDAVLRWGFPGYVNSTGIVINNAGKIPSAKSLGSNRVSLGSHIWRDTVTGSIAFSNLATIGNTANCSFHSITDTNITQLQAYSIGMWVYWDALRNDYAPFLCKIANVPGNTSLFFGTDPANKMRLVVRDSGDRELLGPSALPATTWFWMGASIGGGGATLYLNGVGIVTNASLFTPPLTYDSAFHLNTAVYIPDAGNPYNFSGKIASLVIVPRKLSDAEMKLLYLEAPHP